MTLSSWSGAIASLGVGAYLEFTSMDLRAAPTLCEANWDGSHPILLNAVVREETTFLTDAGLFKNVVKY